MEWGGIFRVKGALQSHFYHTKTLIANFLANGEFDREQKETFELIITAHDNGVPQLVSREMLTVNLEDVNDNTPEFRSQEYRKTLSEADQPGTVVFTLSDKVKDDDYGPNGQFSFALLENGEGIFELVEDQIILTRMLDIDGISAKTDEYTLKVQGKNYQKPVKIYRSFR